MLPHEAELRTYVQNDPRPIPESRRSAFPFLLVQFLLQARIAAGTGLDPDKVGRVGSDERSSTVVVTATGAPIEEVLDPGMLTTIAKFLKPMWMLLGEIVEMLVVIAEAQADLLGLAPTAPPCDTTKTERLTPLCVSESSTAVEAWATAILSPQGKDMTSTLILDDVIQMSEDLRESLLELYAPGPEPAGLLVKLQEAVESMKSEWTSKLAEVRHPRFVLAFDGVSDGVSGGGCCLPFTVTHDPTNALNRNRNLNHITYISPPTDTVAVLREARRRRVGALVGRPRRPRGEGPRRRLAGGRHVREHGRAENPTPRVVARVVGAGLQPTAPPPRPCDGRTWALVTPRRAPAAQSEASEGAGCGGKGASKHRDTSRGLGRHLHFLWPVQRAHVCVLCW